MAISAPRVNIEQTQFGNQPIGVVRVGVGSQTANAIAAGADRIADIAFQRSAEDAETGATELAQSIAQADILAIDPKTGAPMALSDMSGIGRIGSEAYRRVINSRFQQGIEEEIRNQAQILAVQYEASSDPVGLYTAAMSDYIASMANNATGQWRSFIEDAGTSYLNRTRTSLAVQHLRRTRAELAAAQKRANAEALDAIEAAVARGGPAAIFGPSAGEGTSDSGSDLSVRISSSGTLNRLPVSFGEGIQSFDSQGVSSVSFSETIEGSAERLDEYAMGQPVSVVDSISQSAAIANRDAVEAGILAPSALEGMSIEARVSFAQGMVRYYTSQINPSDPTSENHLTLVQSAIGAQDIGAVYRLAPELAPYLEFLESRPTLFRQFERFSDGVFSDRIRTARIKGAATREAEEISRQKAIAVIQQEAPVARNELRLSASRMPSDEFGAFLRQSVFEISQIRNLAFNIENKDARDAELSRASELAEGLGDGLFDRIARGKTVSDIVRLQSAFADRDISELTDEELSLFQYAQSLEPVLPSLFGDLDTSFRRYREGPAKRNEIIARDEGLSQLSELSNIIPSIRDLQGEDIQSGVDRIISRIRAIPNLSSDDTRSTERSVYTSGGKAHILDAMSSARSKEELAAMRDYISGVPGAFPLSESVRSSLDAAAVLFERGQTDIKPAANDITSRMAETFSRLEAMEEAGILRNQIISGRGNPTLKAHREEAQSILSDVLASVTTADPDLVGPQLAELTSVPEDFVMNPAYLEDDRINNVLTDFFNTPNFMPEIFHRTFEAFASGHMMESAPTILAHWRNVSTLNVNGSVIRNPAIESLDESVIAKMDSISNAITFLGSSPAQVAEAHRAAHLMQNSAVFNETVKRALDDRSIPQFLSEEVSSYAALHRGQRSAIESVAATLIALNQTDIGGQSGTRWLKNRIETHIDNMLPDSRGSVVERDADGYPTTRTQYALERQLGNNTHLAKTYIADMVSELAPSAPSMVGPRSLLRDLGHAALNAPTMIGSVLVGDFTTRRPPYLQLYPIGPDANGGISYNVFMFNPETGQTTQVVRETEHSEGDTILKGQPLRFSTADPNFVSRIPKEDYGARAIELESFYSGLRDAARSFTADGFRLSPGP